jgi:hypothetical protein
MGKGSRRGEFLYLSSYSLYVLTLFPALGCSCVCIYVCVCIHVKAVRDFCPIATGVKGWEPTKNLSNLTFYAVLLRCPLNRGATLLILLYLAMFFVKVRHL